MENIIVNDIIDAISDPIYIMNRDRDFIYVNSQMINVTGYSRNELLSFNGLELERSGRISRAFSREVLKTKSKATIIQSVILKDSKRDDFLATLNPVFDGQGEVKYLVGVLKDIQKINYEFNVANIIDDVSIIKFNDHPTRSVQGKVIAQSQSMKDLIEEVKRLSKYDTSMLILGETGTGKEVIANLIHQSSNRASKEMIKINCASLPSSLLEAELFGYSEGAFTGALKKGKKGLIELASESTLFLDEIDSLPLSLQGKLLRALDSKRIRKVGSGEEVYVDFRLITATNADLRKMVVNREFREDLYYRINIVPVKIPPLRDRTQDIKPLCEYFLEYYSNKYNKKKIFSPSIYDCMVGHQWPGNVRELKNFVEMMVVTSSFSDEVIEKIPSNYITAPNLHNMAAQESLGQENPILATPASEIIDFESTNYENIMSAFEKKVLTEAIKLYQSNCAIARRLELDQSTVYRKRQKYNL